MLYARLLTVVFLVLGTLLSACSEVVCARPGIPAVAVEVRDAQGNATALGATAYLYGRLGYEESETGVTEDATIHLDVAVNEEGPFTVAVVKPYYSSASVEPISLIEDGCGIVASADVAVTLRRQPDAPPVQQVVVGGPNGYAAGYEEQLWARVLADPGVSREVTWSSSDTSVATVTPDGFMTAGCRDTSGLAYLTATSVADPTKYGRLEVSVGAAAPGELCP